MKVLGTLDLEFGSLANFAFDVATDWPLNPKPGMAIFMDKRLMFCVSIEDVPVWVPLTQQMTMVRYSQPTASSRWEINHKMNTATPIVQCYDENGDVVQPSSIHADDANNIVVLFPSAVAGTAVLLSGVESGLPTPTVAFTASYENLATWVVVHNLGYNPAVRIYQGANEVQPKSIVHDSTSQLTITFDNPESGTVILY
ncbi:hypothetical protein pEaSNUABM14_00102 [Erwinia phage pEa_SNUABM_14]|uniref:Uncharacterized protein n=1 Tax=Erwinia phage pEa_SNUABM_7 TaxID=2866695 RepID=A0AAE7WSB9_9CAUD|nr:hypothetical protein MPK74_gp103 [Erwinia phage pEa_SNUABM_7]QYW03062.1 hypothetical protein pEaSNUABM13_00103 [Erwinia phage pEa_SNUABM_13]QYW03403.1 hypothetical protein pEaSNUABM34_00101 [Erwinia phage pEa_SNUABM_34]QYW03745.1 hypothetical protein pEaSNUABM45_00102 [Erwinia phage pEa_SNUABM_45]QYW04086.1 hypothetical protein pEaSNUABM46_00102 [Erwinia phage pEa_SNUABM_46]QYW04427.1 hypothetical protein pEaSNUABM14_00102 [Erwinia phage pEa_SNUABM_14]QYW05116.1 hypothetical protein pEaSNU